ncbi:MAG TPA: FecR family protein [Polyangiaceae bacterium]
MSHLESLLTKVAREQDALLEASNGRQLARLRLSNTKLGDSRLGVNLAMRWAIAAGLTLVTAAGAYHWESQRSNGLTATMGAGHAPVVQGTWITAGDTKGTPIEFSDGTRIDVAPHAQARMIELDTNRVQLALESGRVDVHVVHYSTRNWELRAGPFGVRVTGTRFNLAWNPNDDKFSLELVEGQVELSGCGFGARRRLIAGQLVHASCRDNSVEIEYSDPRGIASAMPSSAVKSSVPIEEPLQPAPSAEPKERTTSGVVARPKAASDATRAAAEPRDFSVLTAQGKYVEALAIVEQRGFSSECQRLNVDALSLLAETARHARKPVLAKQALVTLRRRFNGTNPAALAAFSLGVLEFDQWGAYGSAIDWFNTYLTEAPAGPLAREARGRIMEAAYRAGRDDARELAAAYLRSYPEGPHAALAKVVAKGSK